jgi:hypothetical protein
MSESQHRPAFDGHDYAFDDNGQPVQVYRPPAPSLSLALLDDLRESPNDESAIEAIEAAFDKIGDARAAEALRRVVDALGQNSAAGIQLRKIIDTGSLSSLSPPSKVERWLKNKFGRVNTVLSESTH